LGNLLPPYPLWARKNREYAVKAFLQSNKDKNKKSLKEKKDIWRRVFNTVNVVRNEIWVL